MQTHRFEIFRKIVELEEELRVVGNNLKSLEVSEEKVSPLDSSRPLFHHPATGRFRGVVEYIFEWVQQETHYY